jgi:hypothetical protein
MTRTFAAAVLTFLALTAPARAECDTGHWIKSVSDGGEIVILEDDSVWEINPVDTVDTALWLPVTNIIICGDELINSDDGEKASARRLR